MRFKYVFDSGKFLPIIPIKLRGNEDWIEFNGYIDTGASFCLFHADVAGILGINLESGEKREMILGDGDSMVVYIHKVPVLLADKEFIASIGFSRDLKIHFYIIGREDLFNQFIICFHEKEKMIEFTPIF